MSKLLQRGWWFFALIVFAVQIAALLTLYLVSRLSEDVASVGFVLVFPGLMLSLVLGKNFHDTGPMLLILGPIVSWLFYSSIVNSFVSHIRRKRSKVLV